MTTSPEESDLQKILSALSIFQSISSLDDIFTLFGIIDLPPAQKYGIVCGIITFIFTISSVLYLLVAGGSFQRIAKQEVEGTNSIPNVVEERVGRALLLESLLEAQGVLGGRYTVREEKTEGMSVLMKLLVNIAPEVAKAKELMSKEEKKKKKGNDMSNDLKKELKNFLPDGYEENYILAYRTCQNKPGGSTISGLPEARYEAYARAYAGCGSLTSTSYRRSYARMYEYNACKGQGTEKIYREHWLERPEDIVGRMVRLEPLQINRHANDFHAITCGDIYKENKAFDPNQVWSFADEGPFSSVKELSHSFIFQRKQNEAGFAIIEQMTGELIGVVLLNNDDPKNLSISLELPYVKPSSEGTAEPIEGCFLLMDRLFALGYRRIQLSIDSMDVDGKKLAGRLGFTQEGLLLKDRIVKESNRDSLVYGMLNSDWNKGARGFLFKKLHGAKALKIDATNEKKEAELEHQNKVLKEKEEGK